MIYVSISQIESININFTRYIEVKVKDRIRIEKDIRVFRLENRFIDKIKTFLVYDIAFENK